MGYLRSATDHSMQATYPKDKMKDLRSKPGALSLIQKENSLASGKRLGMDCRDVFVAREVPHVERQYPRDTIHVHCRYNTGIMGVLATNAERRNQALPLLENRGCFRQQRKQALENGEFSCRHFHRHAEAVFACGASRHGPELNKVLSRYVQPFVAAAQGADGTLDHGAMRVMRLQ